jgi:hypothetical protein
MCSPVTGLAWPVWSPFAGGMRCVGCAVLPGVPATPGSSASKEEDNVASESYSRADRVM